MTVRVGLVGARGHVGAELVALIAGHPHMDLAFVGSRELAGQRLAEHAPAWQRPAIFTRGTRRLPARRNLAIDGRKYLTK